MSTPKYIKTAGASMVSRNILDNRGHIKWLVREQSVNPADNGWRIFSDIDTTEYLDDPNNWAIVDFNTMCHMEPALIGVYTLPVGSDLQLVVDPDGRRRWYDNHTRQELHFT